MNKKEVLELKRRFKKEAATFTRVCGCYVDGNHNKVCKFGNTFLNLEEDEFYKYLEIANKALSGTIGNNLLELKFPIEEEEVGGRQHILMALRASKLEDENLLDTFYDLTGTLPETFSSKVGNDKLSEQYHMGATHMVLAKSSLSEKDSMNMIDEIKKVDGVKLAVSMDSLTGPMVPQDVIPDDVKDIFKSGDYQMMVIVSEYASATDEVNKQCDEINAIIKKYDNTAMLIGEAPCTKDLIEITDVDFKNVSIISIAAIFIIILLTFKSISLPIILVCVIEFAIFINMGIPAYTGTVLPFIASIVIGTIQLGATVDYAILMTNKYKKNRFRGMDKKEAITDALSKSIQSIIVSALSFFAATFGVGLYSNIDMIGSLCMLMARGAIISMIVVIFILPSMFMVFDRVICASSAGFRNKIK